LQITFVFLQLQIAFVFLQWQIAFACWSSMNFMLFLPRWTLRSFVVIELTEDGILLPKHVWVGT
jgi:hypothetical protein